MHERILGLVLVGALATPAYATSKPSGSLGPQLDTARIEQLTGAKGKLDEKEGVFKVSVPRADLTVTAAGVKLTPPMGLTSWAAFKRAGNHTVVMGDLVLLEDQVNSVMSVALDDGLEVTALHNHFFWDSPKVMFMHIGGMGEEARLAKKIDAIIGKSGDLTGGVYKVTFGRETKMHGVSADSTMGVNTWAAFAGSDEKAVVDGDFAMLESELQGVLKALRAASTSSPSISI